MITLVTPKLEDMWFRETLVGDEETMAYNKKWGGAIDFPKNKWEDWYARWVAHPKNKRFYQYILSEDDCFVGEAAYHFDESRQMYVTNVIVMAKYRGKGYGSAGLKRYAIVQNRTELNACVTRLRLITLRFVFF